MVAPIEDAQEREADKRFPQGMEAMDVNARLHQAGEESGRRTLAADGVIEHTDIDTGTGTLLQGLRHRSTRGVGQENITFKPHSLPRALDILHHGGDEGWGFDE